MIPDKIREMVNCYDKELVDLAVSVIKEMEPQEEWIDVLKDCSFYRTNLNPKTGEISIEETPQYGFSGYSSASGATGWSGTTGTNITITGTQTASSTTYTTTSPFYLGHVSSQERASYLKEIYTYYFKNKNQQNGQKSTSAGAQGTGSKEKNEARIGGT